MGAQVQANTGTVNELKVQCASLNSTVSDLSDGVRRLLEHAGLDVTARPTKQSRSDANIDTAPSQST